jgi:signal transduction histidine kinase
LIRKGFYSPLVVGKIMGQTSQSPQQPSNPSPADLTELQRLQAELQQTQAAYRMAQESEQFKAGFLARTAHELRSPLSSIMSLQQLILSDLCEDPAEEREAIAQAYASAQKLLGLLDQMIGVSKAVYGTEQLKLQAVCLEDIFMEVESLTMLQAQNRRQQLTLNYPDSSLQVKADPRWLKQVLVSLVDTPMRLMQEGTIVVTPQVQGQQVYIDIEDQRPAAFWGEPINLPEQFQARNQLDLEQGNPGINAFTDLGQMPSPGMSLIVNQMILELMGGGLEILSVPTETDLLTRIRCNVIQL